MSPVEKVKYKLTYFPVRARADAIRMVMEVAEMDYTFEAVTLDEWVGFRKEELRQRRITARGQMPYLQWQDSSGKIRTLTQSLAILRYVAALGGLYPTSDKKHELRGHIDEVVEIAQELLTEIGKLAWDHSPEVVQNWGTHQKSFSDYFKDLETFLAPRIVAPGRLDVPKLTLGDIFLAYALETAASMFPAELSTHAPHLFKFFQDVVHSKKRLLNYVQSSRRPEVYTGRLAARLTTKEEMFSWTK